MLPLPALTPLLLAPKLLPPVLTLLRPLRLLPTLLLLRLRLLTPLLLRLKKRSKSQPFGAMTETKRGGLPSGRPPFSYVPPPASLNAGQAAPR